MAEVAVVECDDYETLPTHSLYVHLLAGAMAGIVEHVVMFPIDSVKTRMQSLCDCPERTCRTPVSGVIQMIRNEGIWRPIRGVSVVATGAAPAHALYFTVYEKLKHFLTGGKAGHHPAQHFAAGAVATMCHDAIMNPAEVVKQRMQMWQSPYQGCVQCARCVFRSEGLCAFYRSYTTQLMLNIPFQSTHFVVYEFWQQVLNPRRKWDPKSHLIAGGVAGGIAAALTTPLDVIKTVLNTQQKPDSATVQTTVQSVSTENCPASFRGLMDAGKNVYRTRGLMGFFAGMQARVMFQVPSTALAWSIYEAFKYFLSQGSMLTVASKATPI